MEHDNYQDEPFVNILSTSPPSNSATSSDETNNPSRTIQRPAGGALRSRRNPPPIVLSTSPSASNPAVEHMHMSVSQANAPAIPVDMAEQEVASASLPTTPVVPSVPACSASLLCGKGKAHTAKELEAQYCKSQDAGQPIDISDFECSLCFRVFYQPVTTTCGHVFCKQCLFSSLKYSVQCPLCRHKLDTSPVQHKYAVNVVLMNMIEKYFHKEHKERVGEDAQYQDDHTTSDKQHQEQAIEEDIAHPQSPSWSCIIPSLRSTCNVILSCGGF